MQGRPVDQFLRVAVERAVLEQFEVEVCRALEDQLVSGFAGDDREYRHLDTVDQTGGHQRNIHRDAAVRAERHLRVALEPGNDVDGVAGLERRLSRPAEGRLQGAGYYG